MDMRSVKFKEKPLCHIAMGNVTDADMEFVEIGTSGTCVKYFWV